MFAVDGADIYISRGDDASFDVVFTGEDVDPDGNTVYYRVNEIPEDGTPVLFSIKADTERPRCLVEKELKVYNGFVTIPLESKDTNYLPFGEYTWDIRLFYHDIDYFDINTPILPHSLHILGVVGNV